MTILTTLTREELITRLILISEDIEYLRLWVSGLNIDSNVEDIRGCSCDTYVYNISLCSDVDINGGVEIENNRIENDWEVDVKGVIESRNGLRRKMILDLK